MTPTEKLQKLKLKSEEFRKYWDDSQKEISDTVIEIYKTRAINTERALEHPAKGIKKLQEIFCDCCDRYDTIVCCNQDNCSYLKLFTQKLNEQS